MQDFKAWPLQRAGGPPGAAQLYGISAVPMPLQDFAERVTVPDLEAFCAECGHLAFLICMTFQDQPTFQRYNAIQKRAQACTALHSKSPVPSR